MAGFADFIAFLKLTGGRRIDSILASSVEWASQQVAK